MKSDAKKFILKFLLFITPLAITFAYIEMQLYRIPNSYSAKRTLFESQLDSIQILVVGSSHTDRGIDPEMLSSRAFNLSSPGQSIYYDTHLLLNYMDRMPKLKTVLVGIDYFSLNYQVSNAQENWRDYFYLRYWNIHYEGLKWYDIDQYSMIALYTPEQTFSYFKKNFQINNVPIGLQHNGWVRQDSIEAINDVNGKQRVKAHEKLMSDECVSQNISDLNRLLLECGRRNMRVIFVSTPVTSSYSSHLDVQVTTRTQRLMLQLMGQYQCVFEDYAEDVRFEADDFYDIDHLNAEGAEKFSKIINDEVLNQK